MKCTIVVIITKGHMQATMGDKRGWDSWLNLVPIATFYLVRFKSRLHREPPPLPQFNVAPERGKL